MTKQELADKAGIGRGTMSKWIKPFQKQFDEWVKNITEEQMNYFRIERERLTLRGIYKE